MADTNYFYDIGIFSLTTSKTQNPLHLLADAAFISEKTNNKLTQHEISPHYSKCSTNCNQEIFTKSTTNLNENNEKTTKFEQKKIKPIKLGHNTNIKTNSQIKNSNDDYLNSGKKLFFFFKFLNI
jgi:hypothetical protein